jgi:hypothetical protein
MIGLADLVVGARVARRLPSYLRHPIAPDEARAIVRGRLERREARFLALVRRTVYQHAASPYRQLLQLAGCQRGDLERLVLREGVEGALQRLFREGVYLTVDEFKGRRPVVRGGTAISAASAQLRNPLSAAHVRQRSGGSRSRGTAVPMDLAFIRDVAVNTCLVLEARGGREWVKANWEVPGGGALYHILLYSGFGAPHARWFSQLDPGAPDLPSLYRWSPHMMRWASLLAGVPLPAPEHVPIEAPLPIADWAYTVRRSGRTPHIYTFPSSAVRLAQAALDAGRDLEGLQFLVGGEPVTAARLRSILQAGAEAVPGYGSIEGGVYGYGCLQPAASDDVHLLEDLHAVVQPGPGGSHGLPPNANLFTSLSRHTPFVFLNVGMGDQAVVERRRCGCPLESLGWTTHLHSIRSFEKLTAGGMTFLDTDVIRVLEEVLPGRFGGSPAHYQLLEEEGADGRPRLRLLVHPAVGPLDSTAVAEAFLTALGDGPGAARAMGLHWRHASYLGVERRVPLTTPAAKILHLHVQQRGPGR